MRARIFQLSPESTPTHEDFTATGALRCRPPPSLASCSSQPVPNPQDAFHPGLKTMPTYPIRRRPRECKTCWNCRVSKVRCDRNVPCANCHKREIQCFYGRPPPASSTPLHPSFLSPAHAPAYSGPSHDDDHSYTPDQGSRTSDDQDSSEFIDISQAEWDEINNQMVDMERIARRLHSLFNAHSHSSRKRPENHAAEQRDHPRSEGVYGSNAMNTGAVHLGPRSAVVDILDKSKGSEDTAQALPQEDLVAELALGNVSVAYPFVDLWSSDPLTFNIAGVCSVLPDDDTCQQLLRFYIDIGAVLYPVLSNLEGLERKTNQLLEGRRQAGGDYKPDAGGLVKPFGMDLSFLSLLFAVLASGCQLSNLPELHRELTSWLYGMCRPPDERKCPADDVSIQVSCAYQCLRMLNYVSQPTIEIIQILLIISNVLSYNMNAGASYTLLGEFTLIPTDAVVLTLTHRHDGAHVSCTWSSCRIEGLFTRGASRAKARLVSHCSCRPLENTPLISSGGQWPSRTVIFH